MQFKSYPVIDPIATGANIVRLRKERGMSVKEMQGFFGFEEPQAIYQWQWGKSLPSVDNLYALSTLFEVPMDSIIVPYPTIKKTEQQEKSCCSVFYFIDMLLGSVPFAVGPAGYNLRKFNVRICIP